MIQRVFTVIFTVLFILYPVIVYFGISKVPISILSIMLLTLFILRTIFLARLKKSDITQFLPMLISVGSVFIFSALFKSEKLLLLTPVMVNLVLLFNFSYSLKKKPTVIERFATMTGEQSTESLSRYCKKVTIVWCIFFIFNGSVSLLTVLVGSSELWALYNGLISYLLIGSVMGIEFLIRIFVRKRERVIL